MLMLRDGVTIHTIVKGIPKDETTSESDPLYDLSFNILISIIRDKLEDYDDLFLKDADIIYSVSGYVIRYIECNCCGEAELANMRDFVDVDRSYFENMSRGGWCEPRAKC